MVLTDQLLRAVLPVAVELAEAFPCPLTLPLTVKKSNRKGTFHLGLELYNWQSWQNDQYSQQGFFVFTVEIILSSICDGRMGSQIFILPRESRAHFPPPFIYSICHKKHWLWDAPHLDRPPFASVGRIAEYLVHAALGCAEWPRRSI